MKKSILFLLAGVGITLAGRAQSVAADWTLSDCSGNSHTLFTYLNNEEVVIMEFGMGCSSCSDAATPLINKRNAYALSHPGKVKVMYMDYWAGNDCADVLGVVGSYDYDGIFAHCLTEKEYYMTGSPMPGIVVVGGSNHLVLYENMSFLPGDTLQIQQAIDDFFLTVGIRETTTTTGHFSMSPNPVSDQLTITLENLQEPIQDILLRNAQGKLVTVLYTGTIPQGKHQYTFSVGHLPRGNYLLTAGSWTQPLVISTP